MAREGATKVTQEDFDKMISELKEHIEFIPDMYDLDELVVTSD